MNKKRTVFILAMLTVMVMVLPGCKKNEAAPAEEPPAVEEPAEELPVPVVKRVSPVTVVINNYPAARPQSGLQQASIVYEFLAEGGITRFLAVYDIAYDYNFTIGPVRSLRPFIAVLALEHGGTVAHSGYSDRTRQAIRGLKIKEINSAAFLYRDSSRKAPHNLYSDIEKLFRARGPSEESEEQVVFAELPASAEDGLEAVVSYSGNNQVRYTYNEADGVYMRFINEKPHTDRETGKQYHARRVIIRRNKHTAVPGTDLNDIHLEGAGEGRLFEAGKMHTIRWEKKDGVTRYYFANGQAVDLSAGNTWIQVVR